MRIFSVDVGTRNLGMCLIEDGRIEQWEVGSVPKSHERGFCRAVTEHLKARPWIATAEVALIERQPNQTSKMLKRMEAFLEAYCVFVDVPTVVIYNAVNKVPDCPGTGRAAYRNRKKVAIERARAYCAADQDAKWIDMFESEKKKDDLADSLLQALSYRAPVACTAVDAPRKPVVPRRPTEHQKATKFSKSNLAWLFRDAYRGEADRSRSKLVAIVKKKRRWVKDASDAYHDVEEAIDTFFNDKW